jgi:hypothetical protein
MNITYIENGFDCVVLDDCFTKEELDLMQRELAMLTTTSLMLNSDRALKSAQDTANPDYLVANRKGIFLESRFREWRMSHLIRISRERLADPKLAHELIEKNSLYRMYFSDMARNHLLNYYEDGDYYDWHEDSTVFTTLCWFAQQPQAFTGGAFGLRNHRGEEHMVEFKHNRILIIPSCTYHKVELVSMPDNPKPYSGLGRYSLTVFAGTWPREDHPGRKKQ